uniref:Uncharacterized protein n=1 Tax=Anguilla anguilla TaxID=7936 RepID=A0A0E9VDL4_ANGAN
MRSSPCLTADRTWSHAEGGAGLALSQQQQHFFHGWQSNILPFLACHHKYIAYRTVHLGQ